MLPLRYDLIRLGGSWAQRQVFNVTMIQAAIKANKPSLALSILAELKVRFVIDYILIIVTTPVLIIIAGTEVKI